MNIPRIENFESTKTGRAVANQFVIYTYKNGFNIGAYFQSYKTIIAFKNFENNKIYIDRDKWDYSQTTGRYRNLFLGKTKKETEAKIKSGEYKLADLNR